MIDFTFETECYVTAGQSRSSLEKSKKEAVSQDHGCKDLNAYSP